VSVRFDRGAVDAVVLDIEGTTTPIAFVTETLFPYARRHLRAHLAEHHDIPELREAIDYLHREWDDDVARGETPPAWVDDSDDALGDYVEWLMDRDRKSTGLKLLQGQIWERGYLSGELRSEIYRDVVPALLRWRALRIPLAIFSSGSAHAQQLLFAHTPHGDLTPHFTRFFDTTVGAKSSADSYRRIAQALRCAIARMLFVSDAPTEIDAAVAAGSLALLCARDGSVAPTRGTNVDIIRGFDEIAIG
jgi:enolase-phosphatase E1